MAKRKKSSQSSKRKKMRTQGLSLSARYAPSGVGKQNIVSMRYSDAFQLTSTGGIINEYIFRANSIHDPNFTGVGHQPMGHDQMATLYTKYIVLGSKITVQVHGINTGTEGIMTGLFLSKNSNPTSTYTVYTEFSEAKRGTTKYVVSDPSVNTMTNTYSAKKFHQITDIKDNKARLGNNFGANPLDGAFYAFWCQSADISTTTQVRVIVNIDYIVLCSEPKLLFES